MNYDGTQLLSKAVAEFIGCSPKNNNKLSQAQIIKQAKADLGITSKARKLPPETNQKIYSHIVELYSQNKVDKHVDIFSQDDSNQSVELISQTNNFDNIRVAFYTVVDGKRKRQVISLDGYFINALISIGISKVDVPKWVQTQVDNWSAFDSKLPVTRQVKYLIMREVVKGLSGSDDVFYAQIDS